MVWRRCSSRLIILTFTLSLGLAVNVPTKVIAQSNSPSKSGVIENSFQPPRTDKPLPENTEGGATRGGSDEPSPHERASDKVAPLEPSPNKLSSEAGASLDKVAPLERSPEKLPSDEQY